MGAMESQVTSLTIVYLTFYSGKDQRKYQSSVSLAFVRRIHRWRVNSPHKVPVTRQGFHLMTSSWFDGITNVLFKLSIAMHGVWMYLYGAETTRHSGLLICVSNQLFPTAFHADKQRKWSSAELENFDGKPLVTGAFPSKGAGKYGKRFHAMMYIWPDVILQWRLISTCNFI